MSTQRSLQQALAVLARLVPADRVSCDDADRFAVSQDLWPRNILRMYHGHTAALPSAVVWPQSVDEIAQVLVWANQHEVSVVPYGAGSGVVGGTTVEPLQVVLDLKRMQRVHAVDVAARTCTAEAGIMGELLERQLLRAGVSQGHFPSSIYCSTLGGWLATRSAGQASCRYGKIEDQVVGGVAVLGDGTVASQITRPGLSPLFSELTGNEGTLGIWAEATLRVHPVPRERGFMAFDFPDLERAMLAARTVLLEGMSPSILRIYDPLDTLLHRDTHGRRVHRDRGPSFSAALGAFLPGFISYVGDHLSHACRCIIITEGDPEIIAHDTARIADIAQTYAGRARGSAPAKTWYDKRYAVSYRMSNVFRAGVAVDTMEVACPWERLLRVYEAVKRAGLGCGAQVMAHFSHMYLEGGSIYFTYALPAAGGEGAYDRLWDATLNAAIDNGANVSHHHGVGRLKSSALRRARGDYGAALGLLRRAYDPKQVLNPATLAMHSTDRARVPASLPEVGPHARWAVAQPDDALCDVENRLARHGQTLGRVAALFPHAPVLQSARAGRLWRINPQMGVIEAVVIGVDAAIGEAHHTFVAAPRAAEGPDLQATLLQQDVKRLWVRTQKAPAWTWHALVPAKAGIAMARKLSQHPLAQGLQCALQWRGDGSVDIMVTADHAHPVRGEVVSQCLGNVTRRSGDGMPPSPRKADVVRFAATWAQAERHLDKWFTPPTEAFAWADPVGLLGFVDARTHDEMEGAGSLEHLFDDGVTRHKPPRLARSDPGAQAPQPPPTVHAASDACHLAARQPHRAELDNCTFCPKLCRFSCPVTTATGNEAHIPRQMMLATRLDVTRNRALTPSVARTLYSCVDCRGCRTFCDHDNDVATTLQQVRSELWSTQLVPNEVRNLCETLARTGAMPASEASAAVGQLPNPDHERTALFLGCQNDAASLPAMRGTRALIQASHGTPQIIDGGAWCCGHPLARWGHREGFVAHAKRFAKRLARHVQLLVVDDPGCAHTLSSLYPQLAGVRLPEVVWSGHLVPPDDVAASVRDHALHDACFATRWLGSPDLRSTYPSNRASAHVLEGAAGCCGGMLLPFYDPAAAEAVARRHVHDLTRAGAARIVSTSPTCSRRLRHVQAPVDDLAALWHRGTAPREGADLL